MTNRDFLDRIKNAKNRFEAADLVRAMACSHAATLRCYSAEERLSIVEQAEHLAEALERDFDPEDYVPSEEGAGRVHPYKRWLREWGYAT